MTRSLLILMHMHQCTSHLNKFYFISSMRSHHDAA